ncbi:hypothetical protein H0H92_010050, partial [Tricholoma furcatifolium]
MLVYTPSSTLDADSFVDIPLNHEDFMTLDVVPPLLHEDDNDYWFALDRVGAIFRLDDFIFVFQGWDETQKMLQ